MWEIHKSEKYNSYVLVMQGIAVMYIENFISSETLTLKILEGLVTTLNDVIEDNELQELSVNPCNIPNNVIEH